MLEHNNITLADAFRQARTLEFAGKQSADYSTNEHEIPVAAMNSLAIEEDGDNISDDITMAATQKSGDGEEKCFFVPKAGTLGTNAQPKRLFVTNVEPKAIMEKPVLKAK